jgi:hypothetical protein
MGKAEIQEIVSEKMKRFLRSLPVATKRNN